MTFHAALAGPEAFCSHGVLPVIATASTLPTDKRAALDPLPLAASPRRGRALAAKAIVLGTVTFAATLAGAAAVLIGLVLAAGTVGVLGSLLLDRRDA